MPATPAVRRLAHRRVALRDSVDVWTSSAANVVVGGGRIIPTDVVASDFGDEDAFGDSPDVGLSVRLTDSGAAPFLFYETGGSDLVGGLECLWFDEPAMLRELDLGNVTPRRPFVPVPLAALSGPVFLPDDPLRRVVEKGWACVLPGQARPPQLWHPPASTTSGSPQFRPQPSLLIRGQDIVSVVGNDSGVVVARLAAPAISGEATMRRRLRRRDGVVVRLMRNSIPMMTRSETQSPTSQAWVTPSIVALGFHDGTVAFYEPDVNNDGAATAADGSDWLEPHAVHHVSDRPIVSIASSGRESLVLVADQRGIIVAAHLYDWLAPAPAHQSVRRLFKIDPPLQRDAPSVSVAVAPGRAAAACGAPVAVTAVADCGHAVVTSDDRLLDSTSRSTTACHAGDERSDDDSDIRGGCGPSVSFVPLDRDDAADADWTTFGAGSRFAAWTLSCACPRRHGRCVARPGPTAQTPTVVPLERGFVTALLCTVGDDIRLRLAYAPYDSAVHMPGSTCDDGEMANGLGIVRPEDVDPAFL